VISDPLEAALAVGRSDDGEMLRRIVEAAEDCFRQYGVHRTRMEDVAERVGLARQNLYRFVPSKDDLIHLVQLQHAARMDEQRLREIPRKGPVGPILVESFLMGLRLVEDDDRYISGSVSMDSHVRRLAAAEGSDLVTPRPAFWYPIFDYGLGRGELRTDLKHHEMLYWIATQSVLFNKRTALFGAPDRRRFYVERFVMAALLVPAARRPSVKTRQKK
jgi:AcrR family transcriptional regulator